ncbi:MAG: hypothetical protein HZB53_06265 [Chloroflexi bacterium]|nr:hypothetical protein [Chloroflexota bacterium]
MESGTLEKRLGELRAELTRGQEQLAQLDLQRQETRDTLLRISGAIQVIEELLGVRAAIPPSIRRNGDESARSAATPIESAR